MTYFNDESFSPSPAPRAAGAPVSPPSAADTPAVSRLAAKVAHELNNPLDAVLRFVSLAQRKAKTGDYQDLDRHLSDAQFGLQRMAGVLRELMDLGRETNDILSKSQPVDVIDLLQQAARTTAAQAEQKLVQVSIENRLPPAHTFKYDLRLSHALANLIKNAVEASPAYATVRASTVLWDGKLLLTIEDAGPGVPPDLIPQLFTPFLTTKPDGIGHGLGLAISRDMVKSIGGTLIIDNRTPPNKGCIATISLPIP